MKGQDMRFPEALYYALKIRRKYPDFALCGSVALILAGKIPPRNVSDIDFVTTKSGAKRSGINLEEKSDDSYTTVIEKDGYKCYVLKDDSTYKYNLFVFDDDADLRIKNNKIEIKMQDSEQILAWKKKYNRPKDKSDIRNVRAVTPKRR